jgi:hypothetical protein
MANVVLTTEIFKERLNAVLEEVYSQHSKTIYVDHYILEQCCKRYRVKDKWTQEYKTDWLPLKEAQGILKLLKGNEENE